MKLEVVMANNGEERNISKIFNKFGQNMIDMSSKPAFRGSSLGFGLALLPFNTEMALIVLSIPTLYFGTGLAIRQTGRLLPGPNEPPGPQ